MKACWRSGSSGLKSPDWDLACADLACADLACSDLVWAAGATAAGEGVCDIADTAPSASNSGTASLFSKAGSTIVVSFHSQERDYCRFVQVLLSCSPHHCAIRHFAQAY